MIDYKQNFNIFFFDSISKFNLYDNKNLVYLKKLKIFVKMNNNNNNFLKDFFLLSKIFFLLFKRKISVLQIRNNNINSSKIKNMLYLDVGLTFNNYLLIFNILNYLLNIVTYFSNKTDENFKRKRKDKNFLFFFKNLNYFLGLDHLKFVK